MEHNSSIEQIISAIFFLMTRYSLNQETAVAQMIESHFKILAEHPENQSQTIRDISLSLKLREKWRAMLDYQQIHLKLVN